jgi:hypothetical protein
MFGVRRDSGMRELPESPTSYSTARRLVGAACFSCVRHQDSIADTPKRHGNALVMPKPGVILTLRDAGRFALLC